MERVVNYFLELISIPSPLRKTRAMHNWLHNFILIWYPKAEIIFDSAGSEHPDFETGNMLVKIPASLGYEHLPALAVDAHVDTVWETNPIKAKIENGIISTASTSILGADDKAGVAAILAALANISEQNLPHGKIEIIFSVGEESSMYGLREFNFSQLASQTVLCIDGFAPTTIFTACAGKIKYRVSLIGKEAHGAEPEKSVNAILMAAQAIASLTPTLVGKMKNGVIHNIAEITSHEKSSQYPHNNTIPGKCIFSGELRGLNSEDLTLAFSQIKEIIQIIATHYQGKAEFEELIPYPPFSKTDSQIVGRLKKRNPEIDFQETACAGSTHANVINSKGLESVVIGAGGRNPHAKTEFLIINELIQCSEIITNYLTA